ncbi:MAG: hypothetical protein COA44_15290 [Arcobacter sp.]|nr:MAG: hypothetical protein COA44_15290 [Arcobacter sp.]
MKVQAEIIARDIITDLINNTPKAARKGMNADDMIKNLKTKELIAVIAYLQRLGTDIKNVAPIEEAPEVTVENDTLTK